MKKKVPQIEHPADAPPPATFTAEGTPERGVIRDADGAEVGRVLGISTEVSPAGQITSYRFVIHMDAKE